MGHCKPSDLKDVGNLLESLRTISQLKEKSIGCFYLKGKGVLHFHIKDGRRFAHVWSGSSWNEVDLPSRPTELKQTQLFKKLLNTLPTLPIEKKAQNKVGKNE